MPTNIDQIASLLRQIPYSDITKLLTVIFTILSALWSVAGHGLDSASSYIRNSGSSFGSSSQTSVQTTPTTVVVTTTAPATTTATSREDKNGNIGGLQPVEPTFIDY